MFQQGRLDKNIIFTGDPSPATSNFPTWTPVTLDDHKYLRIGNEESRMEASQEYTERMNFWTKLIEE